MGLESFDFRSPDYVPVLQQRMRALEALRGASPEEVDEVRSYYRAHIADFIEDWGMTTDPRNVERGLPAAIPFVLFPRQREFVDFVVRKWHEQKPGLVEKSRDCGISWLSIAVACSMCVLHDGMRVGFGSRKEEYVDKVDEPKSLFWKARFFMRHLPAAFRAGWKEGRDSPFMRMKFPSTDSSITGEAGDDIGRGDRTGLYFVDEAAHLPRPMLVEAALSQTTNCRVDVSSVNGPNNIFAKKRHAGKIEVFIFDWRAQPLDSKLLTPSGWKLMGNIKVGNSIIGADGKKTRIRAITRQGKREIYQVKFSDGASTECAADHLWSVIPSGNQRAERRHLRRTVPLHEMLNDYVAITDHGRTHRYQIPLVAPITGFRSSTLPIAPYLLGYLLGDGNLPTRSSAAISMSINDRADPDLKGMIGSMLPVHCSIKHGSGLTYWISANRAYRGGTKGRGCHNPVNQAIRDLDLVGKQSHDKFIPSAYLFAAKPADRLALLQGLMDADGSVPKKNPGTALFTTVSEALASGVATLAQTLGGTAKLRTPKFHPIARFGNRTCERRQPYVVDVRIPSPMVPFKAARKIDRYEHANRFPPRRSIVRVELIGQKECQCISVAAQDGMYLTDDCIVTHNSDPRKDDAWYAKQVEELDPVVVAQEIDRDYLASVEGVVIPAAWAKSAIDAAQKLGIKPTGARGLSFDVADEGRDKNAICARNGFDVIRSEEWSGKGDDIFGSVERVFALCDELDLRSFRYDADGLGAGVRGDARIINDRRRGLRLRTIAAEPYRGSEKVLDPEREDFKGRKNKDFFANRKSQAWWLARRRFQNTHRWVVEGKGCAPDDIISINSESVGDVMQLIAEIGQPTYKTNPVGKILINKAPDGMRSPNRADALVMEFAAGARGKMIVPPLLLLRMTARPRG